LKEKKTVGREFNIISNEFYENPEERKLQEYNKLKKHVLKKYWETHDYDAVKGKFYDPDREVRYNEQKRVLAEVHGKSKELTIPPSIQYAESSSYNIVNHEVYDDFKLSIAMTTANRSMNRMKKLEKEMEVVERSEKKQDEDGARRINRIKFRRWETEIDRGYNPIKNEVNIHAPKPIPARPATMWERLTMNTTSPDSNNNNNQHHASVDFSRTHNNYFQETSDSMEGNYTSEHFPMPFTGANKATGHRNLSGATTANNNINNSTLPRAQTSQRNNNNNVAVSHMYSTREDSYISARSNNGEKKGMVQSQSLQNIGSSAMNRGSSAGNIPKLDLARTNYGEPVSYQEPMQGPPGLSIPMVRTGGGLGTN
jgi:hypothetical protein